MQQKGERRLHGAMPETRKTTSEDLLQNYWDYLQKVFREVQASEKSAVASAGRRIAEAIGEGNSLWCFGCTHSALLVGETVYRAGGLILANPIFAPGLWPGERPVTRTSRIEKLSGYAEVLLADTKISAGDIVVVISTSGWNAVPVEFAQLAKEERGACVIAITSMGYLDLRSSKQGPHLSEIADMVIDNHVPVGDASMELSDYPGLQMGPVSTFVGSALINGMMMAAAAALAAKGIEPPVFSSGNVPGGMERNLELVRRYKDQIHYM